MGIHKCTNRMFISFMVRRAWQHTTTEAGFGYNSLLPEPLGLEEGIFIYIYIIHTSIIPEHRSTHLLFEPFLATPSNGIVYLTYSPIIFYSGS